MILACVYCIVYENICGGCICINIFCVRVGIFVHMYACVGLHEHGNHDKKKIIMNNCREDDNRIFQVIPRN